MMISLLFVSGQLTAYPLFCTMPGMEMHGMDSLPIADETALTNIQDMSELPDKSDNRLSSSLDRLDVMSDCEQICGYCLSYSQPGAKISNLFRNVANSQQADFYSRFAPTEPPKSLFRPPISV